MKHHTKDKGDAGVLAAMADLARRGYKCALPVSEHLPFDIIVIDDQLRLARVECKYATACNGVMRVVLRSSHADRHGTHNKDCDLSKVDGVTVYCPDTNEVYYTRPNQRLSLRTSPSRNGQTKNVKMASDFRDPSVLFAPVAQCIEHPPSKRTVAG